MLTIRKTNTRSFTTHLMLTLGLLFGFSWLTISVRADSTDKSFDFGPNSANPTFKSHRRTFGAPANVASTVRVTYQRAGAVDIPLAIEIIRPDGTSLSTLTNVTAGSTAQNVTINVAAFNQPACGDNVWGVRVKTQNGQMPPDRVFGNIRFSFNDPSARLLDVEGQLLTINKGNSLVKSLQRPGQPGRIGITGEWDHSIAGIPNPLNHHIRLTVQLLRNGQEVARDFGFPMNDGDSNKMRVSFTVGCNEFSGDWSVRITNNTNDDVTNVKLRVSFTPGF